MPNPALPKFTWEDIRKHNSEKDCWVVLYDRVLDVTKFLNEHPGGLDPINDLGGYDITNSFESIGHSSFALAISKKYIVGDLDKKSVPPVVKRKELKENTPLEKCKAGGSAIPLHYIIGVLVVAFAVLYYLLLF